MKVFYVNSPRAQRRAIERQKIKERNDFQRRIEKQLDNRIFINANDAFMNIQSDLVNLGWIYDEGLINYVELPDYSESMTESPAVRLVNEKFNITLIPHGNGIEISRLEVWEKYQGQGYASLFLDSLLWFLNKKGIMEVYVLPQHAGIDKSQNSLAYNTNALQEFYKRRGFQKMENSYYWKLGRLSAIDIQKVELGILANK
jgi:GNAT superfamily N-acetyltransferase